MPAAGGGGGGGNPYDDYENTLLLNHMDDDDSPAWKDYSSDNLTPVLNNTPTRVAGVFGEMARCDSANWIEYSGLTGPGNSAWTVESRMTFRNSLGSNIIQHNDFVGNDYLRVLLDTNRIRVLVGGVDVVPTGPQSALSTDVTYHVVISHDGAGTYSLQIDGAASISTAEPSAVRWTEATANFQWRGGSGGCDHDECRVVAAKVFPDEGFTVPVIPYSNS
jgi:hypothetical protein